MGWFTGKKSHRTESYSSLEDTNAQRNTGPVMPTGRTRTYRVRGTNNHIRATGLSYTAAQNSARPGERIEPE